MISMMTYRRWTQMQKMLMISYRSLRLKKCKRPKIRQWIQKVKMIMKSSRTFTTRDSLLRTLMAKRIIIAQTRKYISNT